MLPLPLSPNFPLLPLSSLPVVEAQNLLTGEVLAQCDTREPFRQLFTQLYDYAKYGTPFKRGGVCVCGGVWVGGGGRGGERWGRRCSPSHALWDESQVGKARGGRRQLVMPNYTDLLAIFSTQDYAIYPMI